ncbi:MAG: segregation and condensation protein A [Burkholderiales bacterium]
MSQVIAKLNNHEITELPRDLYIDPEALQVFLDMFEGPLDLLLYLIRKQNLDILAIPIAKITDQYILYINAMQVLNINLAAEYLLMAAMLLEIKSRMLLPQPKRATVEEDIETDPRQELIQKLLEYEKIKLAAINLAKVPTVNRDYMWLDVLMNESEPLLAQLNPDELKKAWHTALLKSMVTHKEHHIKRQELSVREHMANLVRKLAQVHQASFLELFDHSQGIAHVVVNFIAILELAKEGLIQLTSKSNDEIVVMLTKREKQWI